MRTKIPPLTFKHFNSLVRYFRLNFFILTGLLLVLNCQHDDLIKSESQNDIEVSNITYLPNGMTLQVISRTDIDNPKVLQIVDSIKSKKKLKILSKNTLNKTITNDSLQISISDEYISYIESEDGLYHSYTFPAYDHEHPEGVKNLLISLQPDGSYKEMIVSYNLNETELELLNAGAEIDIRDKVTYFPLQNNTFSNDIFSKTYYNADGCYSYDYVRTRCIEGGHTYDDAGCPWEGTFGAAQDTYTLVLNFTDCPTSGGENDNNSNTGNPSDNPNDSNTNNPPPDGNNTPNGTTTGDNDNPDVTVFTECEGRDCPEEIGDVEDDCNTSKEDLMEVFPNTSETRLEEIAEYINEHAQDFGIDIKEELQHFLAQAGHESSFPAAGQQEFESFEESLNYRVNYLGINYWRSKFNPYTSYTNPPTTAIDSTKQNPNNFASTTSNVYVDHEKFANFVYDDANRSDPYKIGNVNEGDGYKFRGRGIIQLTGRTNYTNFNSFYRENYDNSIDLLENPDLAATDMEIAVISALWFFKNNVLDQKTIDSSTSVLEITEIVNGGDTGIDHRKQIFLDCETHIDCIE